MLKSEKLLIFQKGSPGRIGFNLDLDSFPRKEISESHQRKDPSQRLHRCRYSSMLEYSSLCNIDWVWCKCHHVYGFKKLLENF